MSHSNMQFEFRTVNNVMTDHRLEPQTAALQSYNLHGALNCVGIHVNTNPSVTDFYSRPHICNSCVLHNCFVSCSLKSSPQFMITPHLSLHY